MFSMLLAMGLAASPAACPGAPTQTSLVQAEERGEARYDAVEQILDSHNRARREVGAPPLRWNNRLANEAKAWADEMANNGMFRHSSYAARANTGENLWMGTAGYFSLQDMIQAFVSEKQYFQYGRFPNVSRTGNWSQVGHYTQVVWEDTREVGCALAEGNSYHYLVCRYWPAGNVMGHYPF